VHDDAECGSSILKGQLCVRSSSEARSCVECNRLGTPMSKWAMIGTLAYQPRPSILSARHDPTKARRSDPRTTLGRSLWICWPTKLTRRTRFRWRLRPVAACWLPVCTPPGACRLCHTPGRHLTVAAPSPNLLLHKATSNRLNGCDRPIGNPQVAGSSPARPTA
jgi:hypothetical protein